MPARSQHSGGPHLYPSSSRETFREPIARGRFLRAPTSPNYAAPSGLICVPTPLTAHREPDLTYVENTARAIAPHIKPGQLVVLESTTYPGTTRDVVEPILESSGIEERPRLLHRLHRREDPGNMSSRPAPSPR